MFVAIYRLFRKRFSYICEVQVRFVVKHISNVNIVTNTFEASIKLTADWVAEKDVVMATCNSKAATFNSGLLEWMPNIAPEALSVDEGV